MFLGVFQFFLVVVCVLLLGLYLLGFLFSVFALCFVLGFGEVFFFFGFVVFWLGWMGVGFYVFHD